KIVHMAYEMPSACEQMLPLRFEEVAVVIKPSWQALFLCAVHADPQSVRTNVPDSESIAQVCPGLRLRLSQCDGTRSDLTTPAGRCLHAPLCFRFFSRVVLCGTVRHCAIGACAQPGCSGFHRCPSCGDHGEWPERRSI